MSWDEVRDTLAESTIAVFGETVSYDDGVNPAFDVQAKFRMEADEVQDGPITRIVRRPIFKIRIADLDAESVTPAKGHQITVGADTYVVNDDPFEKRNGSWFLFCRTS